MPDPDTIIVRRLLPHDWAEFRRIRLRALGDAPYAFSSTLEEAVQLGEEEWRRRLGTRAQFIASNGRGPVGTAGGFEDDGRAELISMWVDPGVRRSGVGSRLVTAVVQWARDRGSKTLWLWVVEGNVAAGNLYLRCGFNWTGKSRPARSTDPASREFEMSLAL